MFKRSLACEPQDGTFEQLAKVYGMQDKYEQAVDTYVDALKHSPENPELLTQLGLLYLRTGACAPGSGGPKTIEMVEPLEWGGCCFCAQQFWRRRAPARGKGGSAALWLFDATDAPAGRRIFPSPRVPFTGATGRGIARRGAEGAA